MEPISTPLVDVLELKLPTKPFVVRQKRYGGRLSHAVMSAIQQVRHYQAFFGDRANREWFFERFGYRAYRPNAIIVIGRTPAGLTPEARRAVEEGLGSVRIQTYDELLAMVEHRMQILRSEPTC